MHRTNNGDDEFHLDSMGQIKRSNLRTINNIKKNKNTLKMVIEFLKLLQ